MFHRIEYNILHEDFAGPDFHIVISNQIAKHAKPVEQTSKDDSLTECKLLRFCAEKGAAQNIKTAQLVCIQTSTWILCLVVNPQLLNIAHVLSQPVLQL